MEQSDIYRQVLEQTKRETPAEGDFAFFDVSFEASDPKKFRVRYMDATEHRHEYIGPVVISQHRNKAITVRNRGLGDPIDIRVPSQTTLTLFQCDSFEGDETQHVPIYIAAKPGALSVPEPKAEDKKKK